MSKPHRAIAQCPVPLEKWKLCYFYQKSLEKQKLNLSCCALFHMKIKVSLKYSVSYCIKKKNWWKDTRLSQKSTNSWRFQVNIYRILFENRFNKNLYFLEEVYEIWITKYLFSDKVLYEFPQPFKVSRICYNFLVSTI